jgi:hypothetical protein
VEAGRGQGVLNRLVFTAGIAEIAEKRKNVEKRGLEGLEAKTLILYSLS